LTIAAVTAGILALIKRAEAIREASRAESRALASDALNNAETETDLAALLALEGVRVANTTDARGSLAEVLSEPTRFLQRTDVHEGPITAIAFSENGRIAATGDQFGAVKVWDVNEEPLAVPQATPRDPGFELGYEIVDLFVVDDEDLQGVIGFDDEGFVYFIDLTTDDVSTVEPPDVFVSAAFNPEASLVAGLTDDGMLHVYSIDDNFDYVEQGDGLDLNSIGDLSPGEVPILTFSPDGGAVAIHLGTTFLVWPWADNGDWWGEELATPINSIAFSPDLEPERSIVAVGEDAGIIHLFDRQNPALRTLADPPAVNQLFDLAFKPVADDDGNFALASAHSNGDVVLWTVIPDPEFEPFGFEVDRLLGHNDETKKVAFAPDGRIASGDFSGEIIWWLDVPISSLGLGLFPDSEISEVRDAAFIDSTLVASIDADGTVWIWDEESFEGEAVNGGDVWSLDAAAGSIAVGLADGSVAILDPDGAETGRLGPAEPAPVAHVSLRTDGGGLVTVSEQGDTAVWDVAAGSILSEPELPEGFRPDSALHGDEGVVWIGGQDATDLPVVIKFDAGSGAQLGWLQHSDRGGNGVTALALSEDGNILATGSMDRRVQLWDSETLDATKDTEFTGHKGNVTGIVFWDDGNTLISSDDAGEVLVWDVSERRLFGVLGGPTDDVMSLEVDDASATLLASSEDGAVWTWTLDPAQWRARACELAGRNMTQAEWDRYGDGKKRVRHCEQWPPDGNDVRDANYSDNLTD
jgi:WD40 repeat protein